MQLKDINEIISTIKYVITIINLNCILLQNTP